MNHRPDAPKHVTEGGKDGKKSGGSGKSPFGNPNAQRMWIILGVIVLVMFLLVFNGRSAPALGAGLPINQLASLIRQGGVERIDERGGTDLLITFTDGTTRTAYKDASASFYELMGALDVSGAALERLTYVQQPGDNSQAIIFQILIGVVPILIIVWFLWRMMRSMRAGQDQAMSFGRSKPRVARDMERPQVTFTDVAGAEEAKEDLQEIVEFLKEPEKFIRLGARVPKGVLMVGAAGHRQDLDGAGGGGGSGRALLQHFRLGIRGDVRRRWRQPGARFI